MFLTLKNGLEAGSFILQIFVGGEGGSGRQIKSIHDCFLPSGFESMQHSIDWWRLCHGNNEAKNYLTYTGHQFSRDVSGGCLWHRRLLRRRYAWHVFCLYFQFDRYDHSSPDVFDSSLDVRMFLSWLECLNVVPWNWAWWTWALCFWVVVLTHSFDTLCQAATAATKDANFRQICDTKIRSNKLNPKTRCQLLPAPILLIFHSQPLTPKRMRVIFISESFLKISDTINW